MNAPRWTCSGCGVPQYDAPPKVIPKPEGMPDSMYRVELYCSPECLEIHTTEHVSVKPA